MDGMLKFKKIKTLFSLLVFLLLVLMPVVSLFVAVPKVYAATSPTLSALTDFSVLGGQEVTCTGATTTTGGVGVSPGTSITGFPVPCTAGGIGTQINTASAIAAQTEALTTFSTLDQTCDINFGAQDLTTADFSANGGGVGSAPPGVYCSTSSFSLSGTLTLTGSGVHIFKTVSTLITSAGSSVTGGDSCNTWWRVGSSATLGTTTAFRGNVFALNGVNAMNSGATLNGRWVGLSAATMTLNANSISGPTCASPTSTPTPSSSSSSTSSTNAPAVCVSTGVNATPLIIETRRTSPTSIYLNWGPYEGVNTFIVEYGAKNGEWLYNVKVTGFSTTINTLSPNQPYWFRVAATDNCAVGSYSVARLAGIGLPNTGIDPDDKNIPWNIIISLGAIASLLLLLATRRKQTI